MTKYNKPIIKSFNLEDLEQGNHFISDAWRFTSNSPWAEKWEKAGIKWARSG